MCEQQYQPRLYLLSPEGIDDLDQAARTILESTGLNVHHPEARQLMMARGARAAEGARLVIPSSLVDRALGTAPREVTIYDRLGRPAMPLGPHRIYFGTGSDLMQTRDLDTGQRRPSTLSDVARAAHLCDALPEIDFVMSFALPHDVSEEDVEPQQYHAMVSSTTKPVIMTSYSGRPTLARQHAMACLVAGDEASFRRRPTYILYGQFVSPLQHDQGALDRLLFCADHEIPLIYVPTIMPGASGPLTLAGSLALAVAESLAGLVLQQARRPGAPFIFGACVSPLDMRTMLFPYGSPEWRASDLALAEVAREYGLPVFGTGGATDSTLVDAQAGAEYASSLLVAALAGTNLIHDVGYLDSGITGSLESIVLGAEVTRWVKQFMRGLAVSPETLALDVIQEVGPAGSFLSHRHTLRHLRRDVWAPQVSTRQPHGEWQAAGGNGYAQRAQAQARQLLQSHQPEPLDPSLDRSLRNLAHLAGWQTSSAAPGA